MNTEKIRFFRGTKQKEKENIEFIAFDVETANNNRDFVCCSFYSEKEQYVEWDLNAVLERLTTCKNKRQIFVATNLDFDFFAIFKHSLGHLSLFKPTYRDSKMISARITQKHKKIILIDTLSYVSASVEELGKIVNIPKLEHPEFLGNFPSTQAEKEQLDRYCLNDSKISYFAMRYIYDGFRKLGANFKLTIASTSMSIFRNKYFKNSFFCHKKEEIKEILKGYYGGRTEVFERGIYENIKCYDVNSLYPFCMKNFKVPNPNTIRFNTLNDTAYLMNYDGFTEVTITAPENLQYPLLPYKDEKTKRLIFPVGEFRGMYSNVEIKKALELGYIISTVHKNIYFKESINLFSEFVDDLYNLRLKYKAENNPVMALCCKIVSNSLYGKFSQRPDEQTDLYFMELPENVTSKKYTSIETLDNNGITVFICKKEGTPALFCFPEISAYITAYSRLHLYSIMKDNNPLYVDTDSVFTKNVLSTGEHLGELKLEFSANKICFVKPKFYAYETDDKSKGKCKGIHLKMDYDNLIHLTKTKEIDYKKFAKFKESMRIKDETKRRYVNEIITVHKVIDVNDNKREWKEEFNFNQQNSVPIKLKIKN